MRCEVFISDLCILAPAVVWDLVCSDAFDFFYICLNINVNLVGFLGEWQLDSSSSGTTDMQAAFWNLFSSFYSSKFSSYSMSNMFLFEDIIVFVSWTPLVMSSLVSSMTYSIYGVFFFSNLLVCKSSSCALSSYLNSSRYFIWYIKSYSRYCLINLFQYSGFWTQSLIKIAWETYLQRSSGSGFARISFSHIINI